MNNLAKDQSHLKHQYLLQEMRTASLRARVMQADFEAIGLALKGGLITAEQALGLLHDVGLLRLIGTPVAGGNSA